MLLTIKGHPPSRPDQSLTKGVQRTCLEKSFQLTPFLHPSIMPTPTMPPITHWEEEVGRPSLHMCDSRGTGSGAAEPGRRKPWNDTLNCKHSTRLVCLCS
jgi:hypothetical protein